MSDVCNCVRSVQDSSDLLLALVIAEEEEEEGKDKKAMNTGLTSAIINTNCQRNISYIDMPYMATLRCLVL